MEEERNAAESYLADLRARIAEKESLRKKNLAADSEGRPDENFLRKLDSSLKKNSTFIKKLKNLSESQRTSLVTDFGALNLSKYVGEIASSITEVKLKMSDISAAVELSCLAHQRYADFASEMLDSWRKILPSKKTDKIANPSKLRVDLRLFAELITVGIFPDKDGLQLLGSVLVYLVQMDKEAGDYKNLATLCAFLKYCGFEYLGKLPRKISSQNLGLDLPTSFVGVEKQRTINKLVSDYYAYLSERLLADYQEVRRQEKKNQLQYLTKGEVFEDAAKKLEEGKQALEALQKNVLQLADLIDADPPKLPEPEPEDPLLSEPGMSIHLDNTFRDGHDGGGLWEDEDTRQFYETLPELRALLPGILFKESETATLAPLEEKIEEEVVETVEEASVEVDIPDEEENAEAAEPEEEEASVSGGGSLRLIMEGFIGSLPTLINRDMIDNAATEFVTTLNTKSNRKKLARALFEVPRTRLDLLPFYSRLVAILYPVMPDVGTELVQNLKMEFRRLLRKKDQIKVESKLKNVRFIAELCKFKIYPKSEALHCFKMLLFNFRHHAIDMAAAFLETAGYWLYHSGDSHQKTKLLLEEMMRKREQLDPRYQLMVDNAYFNCNPPAGGGGPVKIDRPPIHDFLRHVLFFDLCKGSAVKTLRALRKIDWSDETVSNFAIECFSSPGMVKFGSIQYLASVLAGVMSIHDWVGVEVVDAVLEDIRLGMEVNHPKLNQRRISSVKYLGELYNYRVIDSGIIFGLLYSLITFGCAADGSSPIDPPEHLFRIRLVCVLLETCGGFFEKGTAGKKLDCFLIYFQRYFWQKKASPIWDDATRPFPTEAESLLVLLRDQLRPNLDLFEYLDEAEDAVKKLEDEYREKALSELESLLKFKNTDEEAGAEEECWAEDGLAPIQEGEEEDEEKGSQSQAFSQGTRWKSFENAGLFTRSYSRNSQLDADSEGEEDEDDEDTVRVHRGDNQRSAEDDEFVAAFDRLMMETVQERVVTAPKVAQVEIVIPARLKKGVQFDEDVKDEEMSPDNLDEEVADEEEQAPTRRFRVLLRGKGNRTTTKPIEIPVSAEFVRALEDQEETRKREREQMKLHTLNQARRIEEEELAEEQNEIRKLTFQTKKKKGLQGANFQHQKGAPSSHQFYGGWT